MTTSLLLLALLAATACKPSPETPPTRQPIIDVHLHAFGTDWANYFKDTSWFPPLPRPGTDDSLREQTLRLLEQFNVARAVASGVDPKVIDQWRSAAFERIIPALVLMLGTPIDTIRARVKDSTIQVLGEAIWQFEGVAPDNKRLKPFWSLDVAGINADLPRPEFHAYLRRLVDAGFTRNIMYGSDQAVWPTITLCSIEAIESADFLSPEQERAILCGNAARFLRLDPKLCEGGVQ